MYLWIIRIKILKPFFGSGQGVYKIGKEELTLRDSVHDSEDFEDSPPLH